MATEETKADGSFTPKDTGRARGTTLALLFGFLGVLAVGAMIYLRPIPDPTTVVVAVGGCSEPCRENLALSMSFVLETQGFLVENRGGESAATMDELRAIAVEQNAVHSIWLNVGTLDTVADSSFVAIDGVAQSANEAAVARDIEVALEAVREERVESEPLRDEDAVRIEAGLVALDALSPDLVSALFGSEVMQTYLAAEPRDTSTAVSTHTQLTQAAEDNHARVMNARSFTAACDEVGEAYAASGDTELGVSCSTRGCEQDHLVGVREDRLIVQRESRYPVFPLREQHDVVSAPTPHSVLLRGESDVRRVRARSIYGYASADGDDVSYVSASDRAFSLFLVEEDQAAPSLMAVAERPGLLSNPQLSDSWILFERRPFRGADPVLMAVRRDAPRPSDPTEAPAAIEVTPFGVQGNWLSLGSPEGRGRYAAVWVAGIREETRAALEAQGNGERIDEAEAIDDLDDDLDAERLARVAAGLPPKDHIALVRFGEDDATLVGRFGGRSFPLSFAQATPSGALVLIRAGGGMCEHLRLEPQDWSAIDLEALDPEEHPWRRLESCPSFPVVAENAIYGTERVSGGDDPFEGDTELVRFDIMTGARTQLTFNSIDERFVRVHAGSSSVRVAFERVPPPRFARFRPSGVCVLEDTVHEAPATRDSQPAL